MYLVVNKTVHWNENQNFYTLIFFSPVLGGELKAETQHNTSNYYACTQKWPRPRYKPIFELQAFVRWKLMPNDYYFRITAKYNLTNKLP